MGLWRGTASFRRFEVREAVGADVGERFQEAVRRFRFVPLDPKSEVESSAGWVSRDNPFDTDLPASHWLQQGWVCLGLRVDTRRVPAKALRYECLAAEAEHARRTGGMRLNRVEKEELRRQVRRRLLEKAPADMKVIDSAWDVERGEVFLGSTSNRVADMFADLFTRTFGVRLRPLFPYAMALRVGGDRGEAAVSAQGASSFASGG